MKHLLAISWLILSHVDYTSGEMCQDQQFIPGEYDMFSPFVDTYDSHFGDLATNTTIIIEDVSKPSIETSKESLVFVKDSSLTYEEGSIFN